MKTKTYMIDMEDETVVIPKENYQDTGVSEFKEIVFVEDLKTSLNKYYGTHASGQAIVRELFKGIGLS